MPQPQIPYELYPIDNYKTSRGAADIHNGIATYLQIALPAFIDQARIDWDRDEYQLPYPKKYGAYNPKQIDRYPAIVTIVTRDSEWATADYDRQIGLEFSAQWDVKLYIWIHSPEDTIGWIEPIYENTLQLRDDMVTLTRAALLIDPGLGTETRFMHIGDMTAEYLEIQPASEQRPDYMTVATLSFTLTSKETVARKPLGVVEFTEVETGLLPYPTIEGHVP